MKAKELMVGDWVYNNNNTPIKIDFLSDTLQIGDLKFEGKLIKPIPLTEEILKANGWCTPKYYGGASSQYETHGGDICITIDAIYHCLDIRIDDINYDMPRPRLVHELQHALRLCGLTELADNFKVE